jgi:hypothetical protein
LRSATLWRAAARGLLGAVLGASLIGAQAQVSIKFGEDQSEEEARPQQDAGGLKLPAYPKEDDLLGFFVSAANDFKFFVDGKSITVDGSIIRFTVVARSPEGVSNVSYEAIRCSSNEYRIYAVGHADKTWAKRTTPWREIRRKSVQRWRDALRSDYFCPAGLPILSVEEGIDALQRGRNRLIDRSDGF